MTKRKSGPTRDGSHQADFKKLKRKVGKKAPQKANVTNTSFTTRSIHVPNQKMAALDNTQSTRDVSHEASGVTNARSLNLHDLFGQLKHYSSNIRRDALVGLKDLFQRHPATLTLEVSSILQLVLPSLLDEEKTVRASLVTLLNFIFPMLGSRGLAPFQGLIISYLCSGLSHMHYAVKRSALGCLKTIIELERPNTKVGVVASVENASGGLNLWSAHAQILPNLLACVQERVFVTRQANIATTESLSSTKGGRGESGLGAGSANSTAGNLANRAVMLQVIELYLALCPLARSAATSDDTDATGPAARLHSATMQALMFPDPNASLADPNDQTAAATSMIAASSKPIPAKYARKNAQQNKFYSSVLPTLPSVGDAAAAAAKKQPPLTHFLHQLLPLAIEYWLESFGLASNSGSKKSSTVDLLLNLHSLLKVLRISTDIMRAQKNERRREEIVKASAAANGADGTAEVASTIDEKPIDLPAGVLGSLKTHLFTAFPFGPSTLGTEDSNEHQQRGLNALNAECVALMAQVLLSGPSSSQSSVGRRPAAGSRLAQEEANWLERIVSYMSTSLATMAALQQEKAEVRRLSFAQPTAVKADEADVNMEDVDQQTKQEGDADMEDVDEEEDDEEEDDDDEDGDGDEEDASPSPSTPARPIGVNRRSGILTPAAAARTPGHTSSSSAATSENTASSLAELLPLLRTLLPRLSFAAQGQLVDGLLEVYLASHPLSAAKDSCLAFLAHYLLVGLTGEDWWSRSRMLRVRLLEEGELVGVLGVVSAAHAQQRWAEGVRREQQATNNSTQDTNQEELSSPLIRRYAAMLNSLYTLLLSCGRISSLSHSFELIQSSLVTFFGSFDDSDADHTLVVPGPFWGLEPRWQHETIQILYGFHSIQPDVIQVLLELMRDRAIDPLQPEVRPVLSKDAKEMVLDMLVEKRHTWPNGTPGFVSFVMGMIRSDFVAIEGDGSSSVTPRVSPLLPVACRMLRLIDPADVTRDAGLDGDSISVGAFDLIQPMVVGSLEAGLAESTAGATKLDLYTALILTHSLVGPTHVPSVLMPLLSRACWSILSGTLTGSAVECGMHIPSSWLSTPIESFLPDQPWMVALRVVAQCGQLGGLLQVMQQKLKAGGPQALQVAIVIVAIIKCSGLRPLLHRHQSSLVSLTSDIQSISSIASQTLMAAMKAEMTLIFGRQAEGNTTR